MLPSNVHIVLIGGVDTEYEEFKKKYDAPNVHIIPHQSRERIPTLLKSADVLVLPNSAKATISRVHASPLKLFEYMASGVSIVASDVPSLHEILSEKEAGFFKPDDSRSLADSIARALSEPGKSREKAYAAAEKVKRYTWRERARLIAEFVEKR
jgi:glycosyltransferase involved in cell wall biosynthesis